MTERQPGAAPRISTAVALAAGLVGAALYAFANWSTVAIAIPGTDDVSLRPQFALVIFIGFAFGPLAGFVAGFVGNVVGDWLTGFGAFAAWPWSLANGLVGLLSGAFGMLLAGRSASALSRAIMAGVAGVTATVLGFLVIWLELWTQPELGFDYILTREYLPTVVVNSVVAALITPLVVRFWDPLHEFFGRA
ncbi:MAG TPA: ECF transporter S component [Candidatus Limnocylindria bacterium]|nr:ECF transporter S component [Candidatus Limnocylindria bacterium]